MTDRRPAWASDGLATPHTMPDKAQRVRRMFNCIAPRYEWVNSFFSAGRDRNWRRRAVELAGVVSGDDVLDVACGTGDFARAFVAAGVRRVAGCDFAHEMLRLAAERDRSAPDDPSVRTSPRIDWYEADALGLPFASGTFSITSCAFGVRNFQDPHAGLAEMHRVLRSNGRAVILEFTRPRGRAVRFVYELYARRVMPIAATLISGDRSGAYRYLPQSVVSFFDAEEMCAALRRCGFATVTATPLTLGTVTVYIATRV